MGDVQPTAVPQKAAEPTNIETAFQPTAKKSSPPAVPHAGAAASSRSAPLARAVEQLVAREQASSSQLPTTSAVVRARNAARLESTSYVPWRRWRRRSRQRFAPRRPVDGKASMAVLYKVVWVS